MPRAAQQGCTGQCSPVQGACGRTDPDLAGLVLHKEGGEQVHGPHGDEGVAGDDDAGGPQPHQRDGVRQRQHHLPHLLQQDHRSFNSRCHRPLSTTRYSAKAL